MKKPFKLPEIKSYEIESDRIEPIINKMLSASAMVTFFKTSASDYHCFFTDLNEEFLGMLLILMDKNPPIFKMFKAAVVNTELYRKDELEGFNYTASLVEYIKKQ